jgi:hypothetical protein
MNCYDCTVHDRVTRPAVGVCHDCGAAVCEQHAVTRDLHDTRTVPPMREDDADVVHPDCSRSAPRNSRR